MYIMFSAPIDQVSAYSPSGFELGRGVLEGDATLSTDLVFLPQMFIALAA